MVPFVVVWDAHEPCWTVSPVTVVVMRISALAIRRVGSVPRSAPFSIHWYAELFNYSLAVAFSSISFLKTIQNSSRCSRAPAILKSRTW